MVVSEIRSLELFEGGFRRRNFCRVSFKDPEKQKATDFSVAFDDDEGYPLTASKSRAGAALAIDNRSTSQLVVTFSPESLLLKDEWAAFEDVCD